MTSYYDKLRAERKQLQEQDLLPSWFTTAGYQLFKEKYQWADTPRKQYETIAATLAAHTDDAPKWREKFFHLLWSGWLSPSTPVLANTGTTRGLPVSCSGGYISDSIDGFYKARREAALLTKHGFGTSGYLGSVRSRGSSISAGGKASGVVPVLKGFVQDSRDVSQGGVRRGSWAAYLPIDHDDFWETVGHLEKEPDDLNIGWNISDEFMAKLNDGDSEARKRFAAALKVKLVTGKGYFWFPDKANRKLPKYYPIKNVASNLCVVPETKILTKNGYVEIQSVVNQEVEVWNGEEWSTVTPRITSYVPVPVVKVTTNSSSPIECTPEHIFYVQNDYHKSAVPVAAKDLQPGDKLIKFDLPVISEPAFENQFAYQSGFFTGDGCHYNGNNIIYLYGKKRELLNLFQGVAGNVSVQEEQDRIVLSRCHGLWEKFYVPDASWSVGTRLSWLSGLMDADGTVVTNGDNQSLQLASVNRKFLEELQLMLQTLGVNAKVVHARDEGKFELPANDGTRALKGYDCQEVHRLLISSSGLYTLAVLGFNTRRLEWKERQPQRNAEQFIKVVSVVDEGRTSITMCFTEPKRHMGMFNGILTGQCSEILLPSDDQHTFTCVLSSMNVARYDEWKDTDAIFNATVFLDCVASEFIARAKGIPGLENAVRFTEKARALGH